MSKIDLDAQGEKIYRDQDGFEARSESIGLPIPIPKKGTKRRTDGGTESDVAEHASSASAQEPNENTTVLVANVGDQPTPEDKLGFQPYVEAIASFLTNEVTKPPLTLSIEGEWGSGKSSFMLQLENELRARKVSVVSFNAWRYDKDDAMWAAFALEFTRKLARELPLWNRWAAHIRLFFRRFKWERGWIEVLRLLLMLVGLLVIFLLPIVMWDRIFAFVSSADSFAGILGKAVRGALAAGGVLSYLGVVVLSLLKVKDTVGNPLKINLRQYVDTPDYKSRVAFIERFHEDFGRVVDIYGKKKKVCVFIDDLDRCEVPKAADLMQALNLMISDSSQLIFIMGMDREKVAAGLAVKYERLLPYLAPAQKSHGTGTPAIFDPVLGLEYGYGFIEKFIQLPFMVPKASEDQVKDFLSNIFDQSIVSKALQTELERTRSSITGRRAEVAVTENSEMVSEILQMVASTFEYNPRRLKQFINAFRLKTFIASRTGLFEPQLNLEKYDRLTTQQLGKFVAITLRWPLLLADLDNDRNLLSNLQHLILSEVPVWQVEKALIDPLTSKLEISDEKSIDITEAIVRWYRRDNLRQLLRAKLFTAEGSKVDKDTKSRYSLEKVNVKKLLQVSPISKLVLSEEMRFADITRTIKQPRESVRVRALSST